jgi:PAS domain S-box-containing protein
MPTISKLFNFGNLANDKAGRAKIFRRLGIMMALAAVYFIVGKLGLRFAFINASTTAVWPSAGIAIAAILLFGYDMLPAIFCGAFLVHVTTTGNIPTSLGIAAGNMLEALIAGYLVNKYANGRRAFENAGDVFRFTVWAGFVATAASATIGSGILLLGGFVSVANFGQIWLTWWLGSANGTLIFAPFLILWIDGGRYHWKSEDNAAAGVYLIFLLMATAVIFEHMVPVPFGGYPLAFLVVPPLMWAAFRFGRRVTAATMVLLSVVAVVSAFDEPSSFGALPSGANSPILFLQFFLSFVSISTLMFAVTIYRQRKGERALAENEKHFRSLVENSSDGILLMDATGIIQYASPAVRHIAGYVPEYLVGRTGKEFIFPEDRKKYDSFSNDLARHPHAAATQEIRVVQKDGGARWVEIAAVNLLDDPTVEAIVVDFRDITERKEIAAAKNSFISSVSYRLCPPLAQAETYIAALRERKKNFTPLEQKYLAELDAANQKMIKLTSDIIRLTRIELGTIRTAPKVVDLRKIIEDTLQNLAGKMQAKGIQAAWKHPPARTFVTADPNLLELAMQRLASKLVTLAPEKGKLHVTLVRDDGRVLLQFFSPSLRDLRQKLQINSSEERGGAEDRREEDLAFGFYMIQSLIELMDGKVYFEPGADGGEILSVVFLKSAGAAAEEATAIVEKAVAKED